jgi:Tol biopolymer transport system component
MSRSPRPVLLSLLCLCLSTWASARVLYVSKEGIDSNTGITWSTARKSITATLATAAPGDELWIRSGIYQENLLLADGIALYGGFRGDETARVQRHWVKNPTVLDGNQLGSALTIAAGNSALTRVDGFIIRNGHAIDTGGGIKCQHQAVTIIHNQITNNFARRDGRGIALQGGGAPRVINNTIWNNRGFSSYTVGNGGGILINGGSPLIANNTIVRNTASLGGGIYLLQATARLVNNIVAFNSSGITRGTGSTFVPILSANCVSNNGTGSTQNYVNVSTGATDISLDPALINPTTGNLHLMPTSPCAQVGDASVLQADWRDMDGAERQVDGGVEIGADELTTHSQPDLILQAVNDTRWVGDNYYGEFEPQVRRLPAKLNSSSQFYLKLENDGNTPESFTLRASGNWENWSVRISADVNGGQDITTALTSEAGWTSPLLAPNAVLNLSLSITSGSVMEAGDVCTATVTATADAGASDSVAAVAINDIPMRVLGISSGAYWEYASIAHLQNIEFTLVSPVQFLTVNLLEFDVLFIDDLKGLSSYYAINEEAVRDALYARRIELQQWLADGHGIIALCDVARGRRAPYCWLPDAIRPSIDTSVYEDGVVVTAPMHPVLDGLSNETLSNWIVSLHHGFANVNSNWTVFCTSLQGVPVDLATTYGRGRVVVVAQDADYHADIKGPTGAPTTMVRQMLRWVAMRVEPDLQIRAKRDEQFTGVGIDPNLISQQITAVNRPTIFFAKLLNGANMAEELLFEGQGGNEEWQVRYFDAAVGGHEITNQVTSLTGWKSPKIERFGSRIIRVELTPSPAVPVGGSYLVHLKLRSGVDPKITDGGMVEAVCDTWHGERLNITQQGYAANGHFLAPTCSADGRLVAFTTTATNLGIADTNAVSDIYLRDRQTGQFRLISRLANGMQANDWSDSPALSADGRYLAFRSAASNLVATDTNGCADIFLADLTTGAISLMSQTSTGGVSNAASAQPAVSGDGRYVVFASLATNLVAGDTNLESDVFVCDRQSGTLTRVSVGTTQGNGASRAPAISADGQIITFASLATNLVAQDPNRTLDVFAYDQRTRRIDLVSLTTDGLPAGGASGSCASPVSADGRYCAFTSHAANLIADDTNEVLDVFVRDRQAGTTRCVSRPALMSANAASGTNGLAISANGRLIAFNSDASNLIASDTNGFGDIFVASLDGTISRMSISNEGQQGDGNSGSIAPSLAMSLDGRILVFDSSASLDQDDLNEGWDLYVHDRFSDFAGQSQADLWMRNAGEMEFVGQDSLEASGQIRRQTSAENAPAVYELMLVNNGPMFDRLIFLGGAQSAGWNVRIVADAPTAIDITTLARGGGWTTPLLAPGSGIPVRVTVTPTTVAPNGTLTVPVSVISQTRPTGGDCGQLVTTATALTSVQLAQTPASDVRVQTSTVTLTATPVGGMQIQYRFRLGKRSGATYTWRLLRDYAASPTCTWIPDEVGTFIPQVLARPLGSTAFVSATRSCTVLAPPLTAVTLTAAPGASGPVGTPVLMSAHAAGAVQYQFRVAVRTRTGLSWKTVQSYSTAASCQWTPTEAGSYTLYVSARVAGSTRAYEAYAARAFLVK